MMKLLIVIAGFLIGMSARAEVSLVQCIDSAFANYPLIKKYNLIEATTGIDLAEINRNWLPRIGAYAQVTGQNVVPQFPSALSNVMQQMGGEMRGLGKVQYKVGVDVQQSIWDGGASRVQRDITRRKANVDQAALEVEMYGLRSRVESLYFGILLLDEQISQTESALDVYDANLQRLRSMLAGGVAMQSDVDMVEAQMLGVRQQLTGARSAAKAYRDVLSLFTAMDLSDEALQIPDAKEPAEVSNDRPELRLFDSRLALNSAQNQLIDVALRPKVGLFAQAYYGYPGIDYFKAMMSRNMTFNIVAGVKISWNIDAFYNRKSTQQKLGIAAADIDADRLTFVFNNQLQSASQREQIRGIEALMDDDARIIALRQNVRKAAESQLRNGVIDATALITKINDETQARLTAAYHSIQRIQAIYALKNTINR